MVRDNGILDADAHGSRRGGPSFSLKHRLFRGLWTVSWTVLASWTPPPLHSWRRFLLRMFGAQMADTARVYGKTKIWYPPNLEMAENALMGPKVNCYCMALITIGADAIVSQGAHLCAGTHDVDSANFQLYARPIVIGPKAWIAAEAFVGPGCIVEEGAVLGARAVAMKHLAAWTIYAGNPAKALRERRRS